MEQQENSAVTNDAEQLSSEQTRVERLVSPFYDRDGITIYNADCRDVLPTLGKFDLLLTDPPYGDSVVTHAWDNITDYRGFTESWFPLVPLKDTAQALVFCSIGRKSDSLIVLAEYMKRRMVFQKSKRCF